jgi:phosphohistidine phosphatase SixA
MKTLELRRHAERDPDADRLSPQGRAQAESVGRELDPSFSVVFVSPTQRAAETVALFLRGSGQQLPPHEVVPGLAGKDTDETPASLAAVVSALLDEIPEGRNGLAVGHTPLIERAVLGIVGIRIEPLAECEGVRIRLDDAGTITLEELRLRAGEGPGRARTGRAEPHER